MTTSADRAKPALVFLCGWKADVASTEEHNFKNKRTVACDDAVGGGGFLIQLPEFS